MKIVYIVSCESNNYYLEQALISSYSARLHNPDSEILIVSDSGSEEMILMYRDEFEKYNIITHFVDVPSSFSKRSASRYLKTKLRNIIDGDYLFVDTDTVICRPLGDIEKVATGLINAVPDRHADFEYFQSYSFRKRTFKKLGLEIPENFIYFNSGVMYVKDCPDTRDFYRKWHEYWLETYDKDVYFDQISLYLTDKYYGGLIKELDGTWNCQTSGQFLNYLAGARIIHYLHNGLDPAPSLYYIKGNETFESVRMNGGLTRQIKEKVSHPYTLFTDNYLVLCERDLIDWKILSRFKRILHIPLKIKAWLKL